MWWVWDGPDAVGPFEGAYTGRGAIGQWITVLPALDLVVAHFTSADVVVVPGGKVTMFFAVLMFGEAGAEILYPNPGFPIYESVINFSGAKAVPIPLREDNGFAATSTSTSRTPESSALRPSKRTFLAR